MLNQSIYNDRPSCFQGISFNQWIDWKWQQQNSLKHSSQMRQYFPNISQQIKDIAKAWEKHGLRFLLTPYMLAMVGKNKLGNPLSGDPIWNQFFPIPIQSTDRPDEYSPKYENWEDSGEMLTPIVQRKYDDRAIIYTADICLGYCGFCLRSLQSNAESEKHGGKSFWDKAVKAIKNHPEIKEVILSGGDPLIYENEIIEGMLKDIRSISSVEAIRIHSRAFTHNPYRIDTEFCTLLKKYEVTEMAVHVAHPNELTADFDSAINRIRHSGARTILLAQIPLLKHVNNSIDILKGLFMGLYTGGIKPYYLLHCMPNIPSASLQRTSVKRGAELMNQLGRGFCHAAMPEYIIVHRQGKRTVPIELCGTSEFIYYNNQDKHPTIFFKNWKGNWAEYLDGID